MSDGRFGPVTALLPMSLAGAWSSMYGSPSTGQAYIPFSCQAKDAISRLRNAKYMDKTEKGKKELKHVPRSHPSSSLSGSGGDGARLGIVD